MPLFTMNYLEYNLSKNDWTIIAAYQMEIIELQTIDDTKISQNFKLFLAMNLILYSRKTEWQTSYAIFCLSKKGQKQVRSFIPTDLGFPHVSVILYVNCAFLCYRQVNSQNA